jgi:hypothetical protein
MNELEQLENRLSQIRAPQMPSDMEARIRERLMTQTAMPPKLRPVGALAGLFGPSPVFAQAALLAALLALAAALFMHDANVSSVSVNTAPAPAAHTAAAPAPNYTATFMVPTINSGSSSRPSEPPMIAPPPPRKHR